MRAKHYNTSLSLNPGKPLKPSLVRYGFGKRTRRACYGMRVSADICFWFLLSFVKTHVLSRFRGASSTGFPARTCDVLATWPRTSVEYNAITRETFQDMVNHPAIIEMFSPVGKHASDDLFTLKLRHNVTSRCSYVSDNVVLCSNKSPTSRTSKSYKEITADVRALFQFSFAG